MARVSVTYKDLSSVLNMVGVELCLALLFSPWVTVTDTVGLGSVLI